MIKLVGMLILAAVIPLVSVGLYVGSDILRPPEAVVNEQAGRHVERARRMLIQYGKNEERISQLLDELKAGGVDVTLAGDRINKLLEDDRSILDAAAQELNQRRRGPNANRRRNLDDRFQAAGGTANDSTPARNFGSNITAMARTLTTAVKERDALLMENEKLIADALNEVNQALSVTSGDASGTSHPFANRLKGVLLMAQARHLHRKALHWRSVADEAGDRLASLIANIKSAQIDQQMVEHSGIQIRINELEDEAETFRKRIREATRTVGGLDQTIAELESLIKQTEQRAKSMSDRIDRLVAAADELSNDPDEDAFAREFDELSSQFRESLARVHRLHYGALNGAQLDASGDFLRGAFVPDRPSGTVSTQRGLVEFQQDRETAMTDLNGFKDALTAIENNIASLQSLSESFADQVASAIDRADRVRSDATEAFDRFLKLSNQADEAFENVASQMRGALTALGAASMTASNRARDASDQLTSASPDQQQSSPLKLRAEDRWLTGQITNQTAQAKFFLASVLYDRFEAARNDFERVSTVAQTLGIAQADPSKFLERRDLAKEEGIRAIRQGITDFERSSRELDNSWTVAAQNGGAHYILALLEDPRHIQTAIENYAAVESAVTGQPSESLARPILERLERLRSQ